MSQQLFQVVSLAARYVFALLGVVIVLRAYLWLLSDRREKHRRLKRLPDAGMVGDLIVLAGSDDLPVGAILPVPREGVLGFVRSCDIVVPCAGVRKCHLDFSFAPGAGLLVYPRSGQRALVDGAEVTCRSRGVQPLVTGSLLQVGAAVLRLQLFSGLDALPVSPVNASPYPDGQTSFPSSPSSPASPLPPQYAPFPPGAGPLIAPAFPQSGADPAAQAVPVFPPQGLEPQPFLPPLSMPAQGMGEPAAAEAFRQPAPAVNAASSDTPRPRRADRWKEEEWSE